MTFLITSSPFHLLWLFPIFLPSLRHNLFSSLLILFSLLSGLFAPNATSIFFSLLFYLIILSPPPLTHALLFSPPLLHALLLPPFSPPTPIYLLFSTFVIIILSPPPFLFCHSSPSPLLPSLSQRATTVTNEPPFSLLSFSQVPWGDKTVLRGPPGDSEAWAEGPVQGESTMDCHHSLYLPCLLPGEFFLIFWNEHTYFRAYIFVFLYM